MLTLPTVFVVLVSTAVVCRQESCHPCGPDSCCHYGFRDRSQNNHHIDYSCCGNNDDNFEYLKHMGPCNIAHLETDLTFSLKEYNCAFDGTWVYQKYASSSMLNQLSWLFHATTPTGRPGEWNIIFYEGRRDNNTGIFGKMILRDGWPIIAEGLINNQYGQIKIYPLWYKPNKLCYFYVCSDRGLDCSTDYRYVTTRTKLTDLEEWYILLIESKCRFRGKMKDFPNTNYQSIDDDDDE